MSRYIDCIVHVPSGFGLVIQELISHNMTRFITYDHQTGLPSGIGNGGLHRFFSGDPSGNDPMVAHLRMGEPIFAELAAIQWQYLSILAACPAGGIQEQVGMDQDGIPQYQARTIYDLLNDNPEARAVYDGLQPPYPEYLPDPETGEPTATPHPQAGQIQPLGFFAGG